MPDLGSEQDPAPKEARLDGETVRRKPRLVNHGPRHRRAVALTFDADMTPAHLGELRTNPNASPWFDARILAELERTKTPATIFLTGLWVRAHPEVARKLGRSPLYEVANHSLSHRAFRSPCFGLEAVTSPAEKRDEVTASHKIIEEVTRQRPRYFRFPGGCHGSKDLRLVAARGEQPLGWDVVSGDPGESDPTVVVRNVMSQVRFGSIVVLHLVGAPNAPATALALPRIISGLRARGYELVTVDGLLRPRSPGKRRPR